MKNETMFDQIYLRRLYFDNVEVFDLIIDEEGYKRVVITHYQDQERVVVTTNLMELDTPSLFDVQGKTMGNDALIIQSRVLFNSFIVDEYDGNNFDITMSIISDEEIRGELLSFEKSQKELSKFVESYLKTHEDLDESIFEIEDFVKLNEEVNEKSNSLDVLFLEENVLDFLESDPENYLKYS